MLETVAKDSGKKALLQLNLEHENGLVNQVDADSVDYATNRAAEMVGRKWVDGELVDNPDAEWRIDDATRDELRSLITQVTTGDIPMTDLTREIMNATSFSPERAELISRTEIQAANAQGSLSGYFRARDAGVNIKKAWEPDDDACPICLANADQGAIDLDDDFESGDDGPPAHPKCECVLVPVTSSDEDDE